MTGVDPADAALFHVVLGEALRFVAVLIALSGLDDLAVDLIFFARAGWRRLWVYTRHARADTATLRRPDPRPLAIIVPAWDESDVIAAMLRALFATLDYPCYRVFVGLYPNDPAGIAAVAAVGDPRLTAVLGRRDGPTTKADCLNNLWHAVLAHEAATGTGFAAIILHDAEDVVDRDELWVLDALVRRAALVQLPVRALADTASPWVAGHYLDDFAEHHAKDLVVREAIGAALPSAGVGTALDRAMLGRIADLSDGEPFDAASLTEDYELGHRVKALGGRGMLVRIRPRGGRIVVATAEHFPATIPAAITQKARWLTGIALAGWDRIGWRGGWADRWMLVRDRKGLATALVTLAAWALLPLLLVHAALAARQPLPPLVSGNLQWLLALNGALLAWRLAMRALFTGHAHGLVEGLLAVPRAAVGNVINAGAALLAIRRYLKALWSGEALAWDKTRHRFPAGR